MERTNLKIGIHVRFADDILVLCKDKGDAERFRFSISNYLSKNMKLIINEEKTKIYDLTKERMKYLGYVFYVWKQNTKNPAKNGRFRVPNELPPAKADEIAENCVKLLRAIRKNCNAETIHNWNTYVVGIHNYYRGMTHFNKCFSQIGWRVRKLFYHTMTKKAKFTTEQSFKDNFIEGRYKSWGKKGYYCFHKYPIIQIEWANWDSGLIGPTKGKVTRKNPYAYGNRKHKPGVSMDDIDYLANTSKYIKNSRYAMFRISKYSCVKGKSYLSGECVPVWDYHCHHINPRGTNDFDNLCVLSEIEHQILHSTTPKRLFEMFPNRKKRINLLLNAL